jgi:carbon storage regulator CsrA
MAGRQHESTPRGEVKMLVLSREPGTSIFVGTADDSFVITLAKLLHGRRVATAIRRSSHANPDQTHERIIELAADSPIDLATDIHLSLLDVRNDNARFGIDAPSKTIVHRLEVYEAIQAEMRAANRERERGPGDGTAGSPVPRPSGPKPPSLNVRLHEPRSDDEE